MPNTEIIRNITTGAPWLQQSGKQVHAMFISYLTKTIPQVCYVAVRAEQDLVCTDFAAHLARLHLPGLVLITPTGG